MPTTRNDERPAEHSLNVERRELVELMQCRRDEVIESIQERYGDVFELCRRLKTSPDEGLSGVDVETHRRAYGSNVVSDPSSSSKKTFLQCLLEVRPNVTVIILALLAVLSIGLSMMNQLQNGSQSTPNGRAQTNVDFGGSDWIEAVVILFSVVGVVLVTAWNDYSRAKQLEEARSMSEQDCRVAVVRGGELQRVAVKDIVVGDICHVKYGDLLPADGVVVQSNDLKVDESSLTGESELIKKGIDVDPLLLAGTQVMEGSGKLLVLAVGSNSQTGIIMTLLSAQRATSTTKDYAAGDDELPFTAVDDDVPSLPKNLRTLAARIRSPALAVTMLTVVVLVVRFVVVTFLVDEQPWSMLYLLHFVVKASIICIALLGVAASDSLSQALSLSMNKAVNRMLANNIALRHFHAVEIMGSVTTICADKTGTLTTNRLSATQSYIGGVHYKSTPEWSRLRDKTRSVLCECIALNSSYSSQVLPPENDNSQPRHLGNKTECGLLGFVLALKQSYQAYRDRVSEKEIVKVYPFNSTRKSMSTVIEKRDSQGGYRVYSKAAADSILNRCKYMLGPDDQPQPLDPAALKTIEQVVDAMTSEGLRTICLAYKDYVSRDPTTNQATFQNAIDWDNEDEILRDFTCIAVIGLEDPVRPEVPETVRRCQEAGITVRMMTGDSINTALSVAIKCGIMSTAGDGLVADAKEFNLLIRDDKGDVQQALLDKVWPRLKILARASPTDKYTLIKGIMESKLLESREVVAVVGDGTGDGPAMKKADVSFAMALEGTDVAKEASDIMLSDDNFASVAKTLVLSRTIYDSIAKVVQFQLPAVLVFMAAALLGAVTPGHMPLHALQILWFGIIINRLAPLAFTAEAPEEESLLRRKPSKQALISPTMMKNIVGQVAYQLAVILVLTAFDRTLVFNTFVLMTLFNAINSRKIDGEANVFGGITRNPIFAAGWLATLVAQTVFVFLGGCAFSTGHLEPHEWTASILLGAGTIVWGQIFAIVPVPASLIGAGDAMKRD